MLVDGRAGARQRARIGVLILAAAAGCAGAPPRAATDGGPDGGGGGGDGSSGGDGDGGYGGGTVSFARDLFPIIQASCAFTECHGTSTTTNHWTDYRTAASTHQRWVNGPGFDFCVEPPEPFVQRTLVVPGDPAASFLLAKLTSTREEPCQAAHHPRMPPPPRAPLAAEQIEAVATWIREGALDN